MTERLATFLHGIPVLCLFLSVLLGSLLGRIHIKGVGFGAVVGTLIAGMAVGILARPELPELLRWAFFYLFLFAIGYSVGPQFFASLKKEALPQIALALVVAVSGLGAVIGVSAVFGLDEGLAVGVLSGGMTQSAALGTGLSAIADLPIPEAEKATLAANAPLADAITYGFGDFGLILFLTWLGPKILGADLRREAKLLEAQLSKGASEGGLGGRAYYGVRAYRVESPELAGTTVGAFEERFASARLSVQRLERAGQRVTVGADRAPAAWRSPRRVGPPGRLSERGTGNRSGARRTRPSVGPREGRQRGRDERLGDRPHARGPGRRRPRARRVRGVPATRHAGDAARIVDAAGTRRRPPADRRAGRRGPRRQLRGLRRAGPGGHGPRVPGGGHLRRRACWAC